MRPVVNGKHMKKGMSKAVSVLYTFLFVPLIINNIVVYYKPHVINNRYDIVKRSKGILPGNVEKWETKAIHTLGKE